MPPAPSNLPMPPPELAERVLATQVGGDRDLAYLELGRQTKDQIVRMLPDDWSWEGKRVLDFGSGAGRTLRHFEEEAQVAEFWAADIDERSIAFLKEGFAPAFRPWLVQEEPPSGLEHGSFDLIYAVSVFTHLADNSLRWLLELHRLLKPGGVMVVTYMGRWTSQWFTGGEPWNEDTVGMNVLFRHRPWEAGGPAILISDWWLKEHWGRAFEVEEIGAQFQHYSWVRLRRKEVELTTDDLERPSDDPREIEALRNNVRQLHREVTVEIDNALHHQALHYEGEIAALRARIEELEAGGLKSVARGTRNSLRSRISGQ